MPSEVRLCGVRQKQAGAKGPCPFAWLVRELRALCGPHRISLFSPFPFPARWPIQHFNNPRTNHFGVLVGNFPNSFGRRMTEVSIFSIPIPHHPSIPRTTTHHTPHKPKAKKKVSGFSLRVPMARLWQSCVSLRRQAVPRKSTGPCT